MPAMPRHFSRIKPRLAPVLLAVLALCAAACSVREDPAELPPPSAQSLRAVGDNPGASRVPLARAIDALFEAEAMGETRSLLVMHKGRIVAERYGEGFDRTTRQLGWSLGKTTTGLVIGMLIADGSLALDRPAPIPAWQRPGDPRGAITLRHLLQMRSGLRHAEDAANLPDGGADYETDNAQMLFLRGRDDMAHYAQTEPLDHEAGAKFNYSTGDSIVLADIATRALSDSDDPAIRHGAMLDYLQSRLFAPMGLNDTTVEFDAQGTPIGGAMIHATARDWAAIGELIRRQGVAGGVQIVPRGWIAFMAGNNPADRAYGAQLWRNRARVEGRPAVLFGGEGPADAVAALGYRGQFIVVVPSKRLTVVRLGHSGKEQEAAIGDALLQLVRLFPG